MSKYFEKILKTYEDKKKDIKVIFKNIFSISVVRFFDYLLPLLTIPYIVRIIGVEKFGVISVARAFITFFLVFVTFGFNFSGTKFIASNRDNRRKISIETYNIIFIKLLFAFASFLIILISITFIRKFNQEKLVYLFTSINLIGEALFPVWLFQGLEKMEYITKITIPVRSFFTLLIFVFVREPGDYVLIPLFYALGPLFAGIVSIYIIYKILNLRFFEFSINSLKITVNKGVSFFLSRISWSFVTSIDVIILGFVAGDYSAGIFSAARKIIKQINLVIQPLYASIYPYFSNKAETTKKEKEKSIREFFKIVFYLSTFAILLIIILTFIFAKEIVLILLGKKFIETVFALRLFLIVPLLYHLNAIIGTAVLIPKGYEKIFNNSVIMASFAHIIILLFMFMFKQITVYNMILLIIITYLIIFCMRFKTVFFKKDLRKWLI